jgi:hypothetical protein
MPTPEGREYLNRYRLMNEREAEELRNTPLEVSLQQLEALYASIDFFGCREALTEGDAEVREMWARAKRKHGRKKT